MDNDRFRFKPCPLCGEQLDADEIRYRNVYGTFVDGYGPDNIPKEPEDGNVYEDEEVYEVGLECGCGYSYFAFSDVIGYPYDGWREKFVRFANLRPGDDRSEFDRATSRFNEELLGKLEGITGKIAESILTDDDGGLDKEEAEMFGKYMSCCILGECTGLGFELGYEEFKERIKNAGDGGKDGQ